MPLPCIELSADERRQLLETARQAIDYGLDDGRELRLDADRLEGKLAVPSAVFVTLTDAGLLRGCVGSLQADTALAQAVARAAFNAAFRDRRFSPLQTEEVVRVCIEVSVLSPMQPIAARNRADLLDALEPGVDGLLLEDRGRRATFLPKVWDKIASPGDFLDQLLHKAGLPPDHWSDSLRLERYRTLTFTES